MMVNLLDDSNFHRQTAVMTRLIEMIIQNPVFGISCIISMLDHSTSQCLTSFTNIQKSTECTFYTVNNIFSRTVQGSSSYQRSILFPNRPSIYDSLAFYIKHSLFCSKKRFTLARINVLTTSKHVLYLLQKKGGVTVLQQKQINNTNNLAKGPSVLSRKHVLKQVLQDGCH